MSASPLYLGAARPLQGGRAAEAWHLPAHHLATHAVVVGMTGSGKTGLVTVMIEEALRQGIPVLAFDVKGDLPNLLLAFPTFDAAAVEPWVADEDVPAGSTRATVAAELAAERRRQLEAWQLGEGDVSALRERTELRVLTPGSSAGARVHLLSSLERPDARWQTDPEAARASLSSAVSLVLRLVGRDADPARSRDHVLLSVLAERRLRAGQTSDLTTLVGEVLEPPLENVGALPVDEFLPRNERRALAAALNGLLASPSFGVWRSGDSLDIKRWLTPAEGRTPGTILSVAHLDDQERALVLGLVLEELLTFVRGLPGTKRLRALIVFDEVFGFMPPHPANPPTKRPLVALMKQARAFGVGVVVATQNPMDLDYRALSNAGLWFLGRLQTDADRERVVEGLCGDTPGKKNTAASALDATLKRLAPRWFVTRDARKGEESFLLHPRHAMSLLRGPMTRAELRRAMDAEAADGGGAAAAAE